MPWQFCVALELELPVRNALLLVLCLHFLNSLGNFPLRRKNLTVTITEISFWERKLPCPLESFLVFPSNG